MTPMDIVWNDNKITLSKKRMSSEAFGAGNSADIDAEQTQNFEKPPTTSNATQYLPPIADQDEQPSDHHKDNEAGQRVDSLSGDMAASVKNESDSNNSNNNIKSTTPNKMRRLAPAGLDDGGRLEHPMLRRSQRRQSMDNMPTTHLHPDHSMTSLKGESISEEHIALEFRPGTESNSSGGEHDSGKSSTSAGAAQVECETCGKIYKHKNCLIKHRWEHHEAWNMTRKWCHSKHQQVQMLEAAQVLMEMQLDGKLVVKREVSLALKEVGESKRVISAANGMAAMQGKITLRKKAS